MFAIYWLYSLFFQARLALPGLLKSLLGLALLYGPVWGSHTTTYTTRFFRSSRNVFFVSDVFRSHWADLVYKDSKADYT